jgi:uncharacterized membrane-anchored protein
MKTLLFWFGLLFITAASAWMIQGKEQVLSKGRTLLLELVPTDPRSLMQGDYMVLAYALANQAPQDQLQRRGKVVVKLDERGVGTFARLDNGSPTAPDELVIDYRNHGGMKISAESFFFEEGTAKAYQPAKYAELKVSETGECLLTGLRDEKLDLLKP